MKKAEENSELSNFSRLWIINECRSALEELKEPSDLPYDAKAAEKPSFRFIWFVLFQMHVKAALSGGFFAIFSPSLYKQHNRSYKELLLLLEFFPILHRSVTRDFTEAFAEVIWSVES